ncbi:MAG TPA: DNA polymerase Y family protein [Pseudonocardiaceae bacterium]|nr:DNA polymerase Y family protein [Pseudonocardiaceae bacterium]
MTGESRLLVVWCPDWSAVSAAATAGLPPHTPVAVIAANRVVACSSPARVEGIRRGTRRRDAQSRCPELVVFPPDPDRDARLFEPVASAVEELAPGVEVVRPGVIAVPARGPIGYFGGAEQAAERLIDEVAVRAGVECQIGVADGLFAGLLAARRGVIVPVGGTPDFLAPLAIGEIDQPADRFGPVRAGRMDRTDRTELVDLLRRMGIRTLGAFAAIPERDVASRFGGAAVLAHRLAAGRAERPLARRRPPADLVVDIVLDPPADRVDAAAFAAKAAAQKLYDGLVAHGLACTRLAIHIQTEAGEQRDRVWRCAEPLTLAGIADRVRWQLDGWLRMAHDANLPSAGVNLLRLAPDEVIDGRALQFGLWFGETDPSAETERAGRALVRVQGLLGPDGVCTAVLGGGRGPRDQVHLVPWGDERIPAADPEPAWPGRLPQPAPSTVPADRIPAVVTDADGGEVGVTGRHLLTSVPQRVVVPGIRQHKVNGWAGPWPVVERWWDDDTARRAVRLQVVLSDENEQDDTAVLLLRESGKWLVEGIYD